MMSTRWNTLCAAGIVWFGFVGGSCETSADEPPADGKLILSAPLTHSDWVLKDNVTGLDDGLAGVRHMLDMCKAAGWSKIYWRCLDAGRSLYPSKLMDPMGPPHGDNYFDPKPEDVGKVGAQKNEAILLKMKDRFHYGSVDSLAEAVRYGHEIGLEIHAWFSINEDDHAWGWPSRYTVAHPEHRWQRRDGNVYRSQLSFAYPEVREYSSQSSKKFSTTIRSTGSSSTGFAPGMSGIPRWMRAAWPTTAMSNPGGGIQGEIRQRSHMTSQPRHAVGEISRGAADRVHAVGAASHACEESPKLPVAVLVQHPWSYRGDNPKYADNLQGLLLDVAAWAHEGLIDAAVPAGYYAPNSGGTPELAYEHLKQLTGGTIDIWMYAWVPTTAEDFRSGLECARKLGAKQILYWEADYIDNNPQKTDLQKMMNDQARNG